jgi:hypothetical protein
MKSKNTKRWLHATLWGLGMVVALGATGCQVDLAGQTLPSAYYYSDDVQYFPPGPEFKLAQEAAVMKAYNADQQAQRK